MRKIFIILLIMGVGQMNAQGKPVDMLNQVNKILKGITEIEFVNSHKFGESRHVNLFRLKNGLEVMLLADDSAPVFSYQTWYKVGSADEVAGKTGLAHLMEHLMFKGTPTYPGGVFDRMLEEAGAQTNAATWIDWTFYYENLPKGKLDLVTKLESDRMQNLAPKEKQFRSELEVVKNERRFRVDNDPEGKAEEILFHKVFGNHPYGHPTIGWMKDLDDMNLKNVMAFYRRYYSPSNAVIVIVGDIDEKNALELIGKRYGPIPGTKVMRHAPVAAKVKTYKAINETQRMEFEVASQSVTCLFVGPSVNDTDAYAANVLGEVLFGMDSSRLERKLVEELGIADSVDGMYEALRQSGFMMIQVTMKPGHDAKEALRVIVSELENIRHKGLMPDELKKARNLTEADLVKGRIVKSSVAGQLGFLHVTAGDYRKFFEQLDGIRKVDGKAIQKVIGKYFMPLNMAKLIMLPRGKK